MSETTYTTDDLGNITSIKLDENIFRVGDVIKLPGYDYKILISGAGDKTVDAKVGAGTKFRIEKICIYDNRVSFSGKMPDVENILLNLCEIVNVPVSLLIR